MNARTTQGPHKTVRGNHGRRSCCDMLTLAMAAALVADIGACSTVQLGDPPSDVNACRPSQMFFVDHVWPEFLNQSYGGKTCRDSRCHDPQSGRALTLILSDPPETPAFPFPAGSDWEKNYQSVTHQMICTNPRGSELFTRPAGLRTHGGGMLIQPEGPEGLLLEMWVTASP